MNDTNANTDGNKAKAAIEGDLGKFFRLPRGQRPAQAPGSDTAADPATGSAATATMEAPPAGEDGSAAAPAAEAAAPAAPKDPPPAADEPRDAEVDRPTSLAAILPRELSNQTFLKKITKQVDEWTPPTTLAVRQVEKAKTTAIIARTDSAMNAYIKWTLGTKFNEMSDEMPRGTFTPYLLQACGMKKATAYKYMTVAKAFKDPRVVNLLGFEYAHTVATMDLPQNLLAQVHEARSIEQVESIIGRFEEDMAISAAWSNMVFDPVAKLGREKALELSRPPFCRELLEHLAKLPEGDIESAIARYKDLEIETSGNGPMAVRILANKSAPQETQAAVKRSFVVKALADRIEQLKQFEGVTIAEADAAEFHSIEQKLLELLQRIESQAAKV